MPTEFVHLHVHSEYSLVDSVVRIDALAAAAAGLGQGAVALTDASNMHGVVKFYRSCLDKGVKPLVGCDLWVENPLLGGPVDRVIVLCCDIGGYRNLSRFLTAAWMRAQGGKVVVKWDELARQHEGLLVLFDEHDGPLAKTSAAAATDGVVDSYQKLFGERLYFQLSRIGHNGEEDYIQRAAQIAAARGVGLVATSRVEFIEAEAFDIHEIRVCINEGRTLDDSRRAHRFTPRQFMHSAEQMATLFADFPHAIANTVEIAQRCNLFFQFEQHFMPAYPDAAADEVGQTLRDQAQAGLAQRQAAAGMGSDLDAADYSARLDRELGIIADMGFDGYFLIVADFIAWSKKQRIPVGPGRGSGAGSLVAWSLGITEIDPLRYGLLFERFLNPERVSLPDFDIDFCVDGRERVIDYIAKRYGAAQVAQITTFGSMAAKAVIRDVGRAMGLPYGQVDQIAKLIPARIGITLQAALAEEDALAQRCREDREVQKLLDNAQQLEGITRHAGKHAAGLVIAPQTLTEYTPLYATAHGSQALTQLDLGDLEAIGLVKFDILGLRNLTIIELAVSMINAQKTRAGEPPLDMAATPLDDPDTYSLIRRGATTAVFQLESSGMKKLIVRLQPDKFDDLVALVALYRPGPLESGMVEDFINRKHGREKITYPHADLAPILEPTYGVIVYQEQVMQIAQTLAGYTLGGADLLRAAMGKKKVDEMARQRTVFVDGAVARGVAARLAATIFDLMEKFAGYGFNKSHSVAYAMVAYHTAWLKARHPAAYMAATLTAMLGDTDQVMTLLFDCAQLGIKIQPPNLNAGWHGFRAMDERTILYGIGAIKGIGKNVSDGIVEEREKNGKFADLFDLCQRLEARIASKKALEALIKSGAAHELGAHPAALMADLGVAMQAAEQQRRGQRCGQHDMFGAVTTPPAKPVAMGVAKWSAQQILEAEKEALGLYLTGHPYHRYRAELAGVVKSQVEALDLSSPQAGLFAGLVIGVREIKARRGKIVVAVLDNASERIEVALYAEKYQRGRRSPAERAAATAYVQRYGASRALLQPGKVLIVQGEFSADDFNGGVKMAADVIVDIETFRRRCLRRIRLNLRQTHLTADAIKTLHNTLATHRGGGIEISVRYLRASGESGRLKFGASWKIHPNEDLIDKLTAQLGAESVKFHYETTDLNQTASA